MTETWKPVVGREGEYEVSDLGNVRSVDRTEKYARVDQYSGRSLMISRRLSGRLLRPGRKSSGHLSVALGRGNSIDVHRLVLEAFVGPCPDGSEGLHWDDNPGHNALSNLRWGTRGENLRDAVRNGKIPIGEQHRIQGDVKGERQFWGDLGVDPFDLCQRLYAVSGDIEAGETIIKQARRMGPETPHDH